MDRIRLSRLEELIREEIALLLTRGEIKDPRVGPYLSITRVEAARDGSVAKVWVSGFGESEDKLDEAVVGLTSAAGFIQSQIAHKARLRLTPVLRFIADRGMIEGFAMTEKIKGLAKE